MLGRRGGRKRTEARLQPQIDNQQNQLNQQEQSMSELTRQLDQAEAEVREAARKNQALEQDAAVAEAPKIDEKEAAKEAARAAETMQQEKDEFVKHEEEFERIIESRGVEEIASEPLERVSRAEQSQELATERPQSESQERSATTATNGERQSEESQRKRAMRRQEKLNANTMSQQELLEVAASIPMMNRVGLRQLLEAQRIDTKDMRRVVDAYLKGENYERVLNNALEKGRYSEEKRHEVRDNRAQDPGGISSGGGAGSSRGGSSSSEDQSVSVDSPRSKNISSDDSQGSPLEQMARKIGDFDSSFSDKPMISNAVAAALGAVAGLIFLALFALLT